VHNSIKVGDNVEIIMPFYDIIKMKVKKMIDSKNGEEIKEAHGGQGRIIILESSQDIPPYSVIRRKVV